MKQLIGLLMIGWGSVGLLLADSTTLTTEPDTNSYAIGMAMGQNLARNVQLLDLKLNQDLVTQAIRDVLSSNQTLLTQQEMQQVLTALNNQTRAKLQVRQAEAAAKRLALAETNKLNAEAFLATNKNNPGVVELPDGLQYRVITNGDGDTPTAADTVVVNYRGTLLDGTEFDSSYKRGQPGTFAVKAVVRGWTEALLKMKAGSKWELFIPPDLGYGMQSPPSIPANSLLIFEVELLSVKPPPPPPQPTAASSPPVTSDIIKVPSAEELKRGEKIEVIPASQVPQMQQTNK